MIATPFLSGKTVAVMGLGRSGLATLRALAASGARVLAWDDNPAARAAAEAEGWALSDLAAADFSGIDLLVWSPGIPHTHPRPHPVALAARAAGLALVCDVDLLARARADMPMVAITGTNGKSTTTTLVAHILAQSGIPARAGGNLGTPALAMEDPGPGGRFVLELSSYQLELVPSLSLSGAALLNIAPDHLDRHGGMDGYAAAKRLVFDRLQAGGTAVIGIDDPHSAAIADDLTARGMRPVRISVVTRLESGISAPDGLLLEDGRPVGDISRFATLPGRHNWQNICAAYGLARGEGVPAESILAALATYPGLAHRQERVAMLGRVAYVNDSKATNADATEKALVCYDRIYWIAGGQAKEGGITALAPHFPASATPF
jgi:UDP-N-acetylmuramoylalanine--D-glutamate ligase